MSIFKRKHEVRKNCYKVWTTRTLYTSNCFNKPFQNGQVSGKDMRSRRHRHPAARPLVPGLAARFRASGAAYQSATVSGRKVINKVFIMEQKCYILFNPSMSRRSLLL